MSENDSTVGAQPIVIAIAVVIAVASAVSGLFLVPEPSTNCPTPAPTPPATHSPIQHVFFIIQENHAFENYFGTFPGVIGNPPNGSLPVALGSNVTIQPFPLNASSTPDLPHDRASGLTDLDGGKNDLFVAQAAALGYPAPQDAAGYYTAAQIPDYFLYAHSFALGDQFFAGILGPTLPNRIFDLAGTAGNWTTDAAPPPQAVSFPTILNQLSEHGISWNYDYSGSEVGLTPLYLPAIAGAPCLLARIQPVTQLAAQLRGSDPPSVTFIDSSNDPSTSEHPPANVTIGEQSTVAVINTIASSPIANSSAVFLFYDENGGYWDPVTPPVRSAYGDGFRVPFLVISPWTPAGVVDHEVLDPASLLRLVDDNWGLPYLNSRVQSAPALAGFFDFQQMPRSLPILPTPLGLSPTPAGKPDPAPGATTSPTKIALRGNTPLLPARDGRGSLTKEGPRRERQCRSVAGPGATVVTDSLSGRSISPHGTSQRR